MRNSTLSTFIGQCGPSSCIPYSTLWAFIGYCGPSCRTPCNTLWAFPSGVPVKMRPLCGPSLGQRPLWGTVFEGSSVCFPTAAPDSRFGGLIIYNPSRVGGRTWMLAFKSYNVSIVWGPICQIGGGICHHAGFQRFASHVAAPFAAKYCQKQFLCCKFPGKNMLAAD